jgi:hypothetical protein
MQIRKTYQGINPTLLYDEMKEFILKKGLILDQNKLETYSTPTDSSTFTYRGTMTFKSQGTEAIRVHIIGVDKGETRMMLDSNDDLFSKEELATIEDDINFMLGGYETPV